MSEDRADLQACSFSQEHDGGMDVFYLRTQASLRRRRTSSQAESLLHADGHERPGGALIHLVPEAGHPESAVRLAVAWYAAMRPVLRGGLAPCLNLLLGYRMNFIRAHAWGRTAKIKPQARHAHSCQCICECRHVEARFAAPIAMAQNHRLACVTWGR